MIMDYRNIVRVILLLGVLSACKIASAGETSIFSDGNVVYQMHYSTHFSVKKKATPEEYLALAVHHNDYTVGALAYIKDQSNSYATGAPLRKKGDVKVDAVKEVTVNGAVGTVDISYSFDGEVVLDHDSLTSYTLYFPKDLEATDAMKDVDFSACSLGGYATTSDIFPIYWTPFNRHCAIENYSVTATLSPVVMKNTYPDYPRLVKDGTIQVALVIGKMEENAGHNPYRNYSGDDSRGEYLEIVKHLKKMGFVRMGLAVIPVDLDTSYEETFEATFNKIKFVVKMVFGNSVYSTEEQSAGIKDFYHHYLALAKESALVVYSGHAGFLVGAGGTSFYGKMQLVLDPDRYQIFVMNGCQTNDYIYPFFALKSSANMEFFLNARESIVNSKASTAMIDAMVSWANFDRWTSYPVLVSQMDSVDAMLGVVGEQDNPVAPYTLSK